MRTRRTSSYSRAAGLRGADEVLDLVERTVGDRRLLTAQVEFFVRAVLDEEAGG